MGLTITTLFPALGSVVEGVATATFSVKKVLPSASLPGYFLAVSTISYLPAYMFLFAVVSQLYGGPVISVALLLMILAAASNLYKGQLMIEADTKKKVLKMNKKAEDLMKDARKASYIILIGWFGYTFYKITSGSPELEDLQEVFMMVDWEQVAKQAPMAIGKMIATRFMFRFLTEIATTTALLQAIFDAADDELKAKEKDDADDDRNELLKDWHKICPPTEKENEKEKKKKKKKDKKEKKENETLEESKEGAREKKGLFEGFGEDSPEQIHPAPERPQGFHAPADPRDAPTDPRGGYFPSYH